MFWFSESELGSSVDVVGLELLEASSDPLEARGPSFKLRFKKLPLVKTLCLKNQKCFLKNSNLQLHSVPKTDLTF